MFKVNGNFQVNKESLVTLRKKCYESELFKILEEKTYEVSNDTNPFVTSTNIEDCSITNLLPYEKGNTGPQYTIHGVFTNYKQMYCEKKNLPLGSE